MRALAAVGLVSLVVCVASPGTAQDRILTQIVQTPATAPSSGPSLEAQYDAAFQEMLRQPANLDVIFKFAALASQTGDLEGAIAALERTLIINPSLPRVRLELGVLYYRLGSYEVSRTYLESVLASSAAPPDVRSRAEQFLAEDQKKLSPSHLAGDLFFGWRYQSNANLGPANSSVLLFGQAANLNQAAVGTSDWGVVSSAQFRHTYDLGLQSKAAVETQFTAYANRQFQVSAANVSLLDLTTGPRFQIFQGTFEDVSVRPFVTGGYIWVNDVSYYGSYGAGLETSALLSDRLRNVTTLSWRRQNYPNSNYLPVNSQFSGNQLSGITSFQYVLTDSIALFFNGSAQRYQTDQTVWQDYTLWGFGGGVSYRFVDPLFKTTLPWNINLSANEQWWSYDAPDPSIDPGTTRLQNDTIVNLVLSVPFDERTTLTVSGGRFVRTATVSNYAFVNNSAMFGVSWRF
jgi:tetratricopeptide (TPR) repeat protein